MDFWVNNGRHSAKNAGGKKPARRPVFSFLTLELLGRSSSVSSGASSSCRFASGGGGSVSSGSSSVSSISSSFASLDSSFASLDSSFAGLDSSFASRRGSFFFLAASGHGNSQQSSQEDGIFHLISLYTKIKTHTINRSGTFEIQPTRGF